MSYLVKYLTHFWPSDSICHGHVSVCLSVCLSVCHKVEFYQNGSTDRAGFWHRGRSWLILQCIRTEFGYLQK